MFLINQNLETKIDIVLKWIQSAQNHQMTTYTKKQMENIYSKNKNHVKTNFCSIVLCTQLLPLSVWVTGPTAALLLLCGTFCPKKKISSTIPFTALEHKPKVALNGSHPPCTREVPLESAFTRLQFQMGETSLSPWLFLLFLPTSLSNECLELV